MIAGCSTNGKVTRSEGDSPALAAALASGDTSSAPGPGSEYHIHPGDELSIKFFYNPELNEDVVVRPDGQISLQLVDDVQAAGKTPPQLDRELTTLYSRELRKPAVTVIVRSFSGQQIFVGGEVSKPASIPLAPQMTPLQAIMSAGGFLDTANQENIVIFRAGPDRQTQSFTLNLDSVAAADTGDAGFHLRAGDVIYVPKTGIAKADIWMDQYVRRLLLFNGFSAGYSIRKY